ncbi:MAG: UDP-N-acetylmuramoyl-tripeptide--D-alanyl-D-alanine ligase [Opitutales bacterium]
MDVSNAQEWTAARLARLTGGCWTDEPQGAFSGFTFDARQLKPGEVFIALTCGQRDGHAFVAQAAEQGAAAALVERRQGGALPQLLVPDTLVAMAVIGQDARRHFRAPVIGVTGSCGKTSTKEMLRCLLGEARVHATAGNWNNRIGVPMTLFGLDSAQQDYAVIEAGINQPGEMACLGEMIEADLCVLTNIGAAHLELLGSREGIAREKSELVAFARADAPLILPVDALRYPALAALRARCIVLAEMGCKVPAGVRAQVSFRIEPAVDARQQRVVLEQAGESAVYELASSSPGMAQNAALALIAARQLGVPVETLQARLPRWRPGATRGRLIEAGGRLIYSDCYNANPDSLLDALIAFTRATPEAQPRCYVLGAMNELGADAVPLHRECGAALRLRHGDRAVFLGPPELAGAYEAGALASGADPAQLSRAGEPSAVQSTIADFSGALFLKGSRSYQLEALLPDTAIEV